MLLSLSAAAWQKMNYKRLIASIKSLEEFNSTLSRRTICITLELSLITITGSAGSLINRLVKSEFSENGDESSRRIMSG